MAKKTFEKSKILTAAIQQKASSEAHIKQNITIDPDLKAFIRPLSEEEFGQLEENIVREGCKDALIVWKDGDRHVLVDGHNRHRICQKHKLDFKVEVKDFKDAAEVKDYMLKVQLGRRNLTQEEISYYRGLRYQNEKQKDAHLANLKQNLSEKDKMSPSENAPRGSTAEKIAKEYGVNEKTVKRDAKYSAGLNLLAANFRNDILHGKQKVSKQDIQKLTTLGLTEGQVQSAEEMERLLAPSKTDAANQQVAKLHKSILSGVEKAIKNKDKKAISAVKKKLEELEKLL